MAAHKIDLQLGQLFSRDAHVGQFAEAGVDAINCLARGENLFNQSPALSHTRLCGGGDLYGASGQRDGFNLGQGEGLAVKNHSFHVAMLGRSDILVQIDSTVPAA